MEAELGTAVSEMLAPVWQHHALIPSTRRPLLVANTPEARKYTAIYVLQDGEIGLTSDVLNLVCQP